MLETLSAIALFAANHTEGVNLCAGLLGVGSGLYNLLIGS